MLFNKRNDQSNDTLLPNFKNLQAVAINYKNIETVSLLL